MWSPWRQIQQWRQRRSVQRRFRGYVDPELARYVLDTADDEPKHEFREATVAFTDVAGFVSLAESDEPLLAQIAAFCSTQEVLTKVVKRHGGFVEAAYGDAFKIIFDAPRPKPDHALRGVVAVMEMRDTLRDCGGGGLSLRVGLATGDVAIGDIGSAARSFYGAFGYNVYVAERLEGVNRFLGTAILINEAAAHAVRDRVLVRKLASLKFEGWKKLVAAYEPIALMSEATEAQRQLAAATAELLGHFTARRFVQCLESTEAVDALGGGGKLVRAYRLLATKYLEELPGPEFDGRIIVDELPYSP
jgi:adenylate cyclase